MERSWGIYLQSITKERQIMIPMKKLSHTWFLLITLFILDYSGVKMQADVPLPPGVEDLSFNTCIEKDSDEKECWEIIKINGQS